MTLHDPDVTLRQMRDHAREAVEFCRGRTRADLDTDRLLELAIVRLVEVVGEAATRLPDAIRDTYPDIPWRPIIGTRNRLIHGYENVSLDGLWSIVQDDLPTLVERIDAILGEP